MTTIARICAAPALAVVAALALAGPADASRHRSVSDALPKGWAKSHGAVGGAAADPDQDGLSNWGEWRAGTRPRKADSDADGVRDDREDRDRDALENGVEDDIRTDPRSRDTDRDGVRDGAEDADRDGLSNAAETRSGHDPRKRDSDGDGRRDGDERSGVIAAVDGDLVTLALDAGGSVTARVDADTDLECDGGHDGRGSDDDEPYGDDPSDDDGTADQGSGDGSADDADDHPSEDDGDDDHRSRGGSDDDEDDDHGDDDGRHRGGDDRGGDRHLAGASSCAALTVGSIVESAEIAVRADGFVFTKLELRD
jgi:hypothetical protein